MLFSALDTVIQEEGSNLYVWYMHIIGEEIRGHRIPEPPTVQSRERSQVNY